MKNRKATEADAKAVVFLAYRRYGTESFRVSPKSPTWAALIKAQGLNYIWFSEPTRAAITADGVRALADFGVPQS